MDSFCEYMRERRLASGLSLRQMAGKLSLSVTYYHDVETGRRLPMDWEKLEQFARLAGLSGGQTDHLMDLAGRARGTVAPDIAQYVCAQECVRKALRTACRVGAECADWEVFEGLLAEKYARPEATD